MSKLVAAGVSAGVVAWALFSTIGGALAQAPASEPTAKQQGDAPPAAGGASSVAAPIPLPQLEVNTAKKKKKSAKVKKPGAAAAGSASGLAAAPTSVPRQEPSAAESVDAPYSTAAPTNYISGENIERFRGSSPADMFRGTPGVMSGEARNGAGSIDVNVRGMQGLGRVTVKVDDAENQVTVYQGYQGISNRTFVDPDLLAGIGITKGSDAASSGIAGTVAMRTLDAADIVKPGNTIGFRAKGGLGGQYGHARAGLQGRLLHLQPDRLYERPQLGISDRNAVEQRDGPP